MLCGRARASCRLTRRAGSTVVNLPNCSPFPPAVRRLSLSPCSFVFFVLFLFFFGGGEEGGGLWKGGEGRPLIFVSPLHV